MHSHPSPVVADLHANGRASNLSRHYDEAIEVLTQAIRLDAASAVGFNLRGFAHNGKKQYDRAILDLEEAIRLDPGFADAFNNRGYAFNGKKMFDRAIEDLTEAIRLDPGFADAFNGRGFAYSGKGLFDDAIRDLDEAIRLDPGFASAFNNRGCAYIGLHRYDRAIRDLDEAIRLNPRFVAAIDNRARAVLGLQQQDSPQPGLDGVTIRPFEEPDAGPVRELFITVNRGLAPRDMREAFESYIARGLAEEIDRISAYYSERQGGFWVAIRNDAIVGMFGLEPGGPGSLELRRMYVDPLARRNGIASLMLRYAEAECRRRGMPRIELSTSALQPEAIALYRRAGYRLIREVVAETQSNKTIGGGIVRYHFEKLLPHPT